MTIDQQKKYIADHAMNTPLKRIASVIGRSSTFVKSEMERQGIQVPQNVRDKFRKESMFKKGCKAWNKGQSQELWMTHKGIKESLKTRFKKGNTPHNTKHDLAISLREEKDGYKYYWIRLSLSKWDLLHRYIWRVHYGDIPPGYNIQFKDNNSLNVNIENLYMVNRSEQFVENINGGKKLPFELKKTLALIFRLKNRINEKQNKRSQ